MVVVNKPPFSCLLYKNGCYWSNERNLVGVWVTATRNLSSQSLPAACSVTADIYTNIQNVIFGCWFWPHRLLLFGWEWLLSAFTLGKASIVLLLPPNKPSPFMPWLFTIWEFWLWSGWCPPLEYWSCCCYNPIAIVSTLSEDWAFCVTVFFYFNLFFVVPPLGGCPLTSLLLFFFDSSRFALLSAML